MKNFIVLIMLLSISCFMTAASFVHGEYSEKQVTILKTCNFDADANIALLDNLNQIGVKSSSPEVLPIFEYSFIQFDNSKMPLLSNSLFQASTQLNSKSLPLDFRLCYFLTYKITNQIKTFHRYIYFRQLALK